jgi:hypothetical protein
MRARMYDPRIGRFTQTDPIFDNRPSKHYTYASNNSAMLTDPMGLDVDLRWGPNATRDAIVRGDWRKIQDLHGFAERKFADLQRLYQHQDQFNWYQRAGWGQYASQVTGGIAERESDLNRILNEGPLPIIAAEQAQAKALRQAGVTQLPMVAIATFSLPGGKGTSSTPEVPEAPVVSNMRPINGIGKMTGFSAAEEVMLKATEKALRGAGYDTSLLRELIRAEMPKGYRAMALSEGVRGAALGEEAFSSQGMLNHVLEEELRHLQQKAAGLRPSFKPGTAKALEEAADAARKFPLPAKRE